LTPITMGTTTNTQQHGMFYHRLAPKEVTTNGNTIVLTKTMMGVAMIERESWLWDQGQTLLGVVYTSTTAYDEMNLVRLLVKAKLVDHLVSDCLVLPYLQATQLFAKKGNSSGAFAIYLLGHNRNSDVSSIRQRLAIHSTKLGTWDFGNGISVIVSPTYHSGKATVQLPQVHHQYQIVEGLCANVTLTDCMTMLIKAMSVQSLIFVWWKSTTNTLIYLHNGTGLNSTSLNARMLAELSGTQGTIVTTWKYLRGLNVAKGMTTSAPPATTPTRAVSTTAITALDTQLSSSSLAQPVSTSTSIKHKVNTTNKRMSSTSTPLSISPSELAYQQELQSKLLDKSPAPQPTTQIAKITTGTIINNTQPAPTHATTITESSLQPWPALPTALNGNNSMIVSPANIQKLVQDMIATELAKSSTQLHESHEFIKVNVKTLQHGYNTLLAQQEKQTTSLSTLQHDFKDIANQVRSQITSDSVTIQSLQNDIQLLRAQSTTTNNNIEQLLARLQPTQQQNSNSSSSQTDGGSRGNE